MTGSVQEYSATQAQVFEEDEMQALWIQGVEKDTD
ncbi:hypothetical protein K3495_g15661 [Podosphaera aphanis]|nr:hypothetical protein K3495_g15661 [Podosphaera aphanis]